MKTLAHKSVVMTTINGARNTLCVHVADNNIHDYMCSIWIHHSVSGHGVITAWHDPAIEHRPNALSRDDTELLYF